MFIKAGSRFGGTFFPHLQVSSCFARTFLFIKCLCDIFKDCRHAFDEKRNRNGSQINLLVEQYFIRNRKKMVHAAMKIIWTQKWN